MAEMLPVRRRLIEDMTVRTLSPATERSSIHAVATFSRWFRRAPDRLALEDVRADQVHLVGRGISWPALNQTVCALGVFDEVTAGRADLPERIPRAREPRTRPVVLSADEVVGVLEAVPGLNSRTALSTADAAELKLAEIDSGRRVLRVEQGQRGKDRYAMRSTQRPTIRRGCWRLTKPRHWLFPGRDESRPITRSRQRIKPRRVDASTPAHRSHHTSSDSIPRRSATAAAFATNPGTATRPSTPSQRTTGAPRHRQADRRSRHDPHRRSPHRGSVQSGCNEVALPSPSHHPLAPPHRCRQIPRPQVSRESDRLLSRFHLAGQRMLAVIRFSD